MVVASSGMLTGGRVMHHLKDFLPDPACTLLFIGYQARGDPRPAHLSPAARRRASTTRSTRSSAACASISGFSAHADVHELTPGSRNFAKAGGTDAADGRPKRVFLVHGDPDATGAFAERIRSELGLDAHLPTYRETAAPRLNVHRCGRAVDKSATLTAETRGQVGWRGLLAARNVVLVPEEPGSDSRDCIKGVEARFLRDVSLCPDSSGHRRTEQPGPIGRPESQLAQRPASADSAGGTRSTRSRRSSRIGPSGASSRGSAESAASATSLSAKAGRVSSPRPPRSTYSAASPSTMHHVGAGDALQRQAIRVLVARPGQRRAIRLGGIGGGQDADRRGRPRHPASRSARSRSTAPGSANWAAPSPSTK